MKFGNEPNPQKLTLISDDGTKDGKRHYRCDCGKLKRILLDCQKMLGSLHIKRDARDPYAWHLNRRGAT